MRKHRNSFLGQDHCLTIYCTAINLGIEFTFLKESPCKSCHAGIDQKLIYTYSCSLQWPARGLRKALKQNKRAETSSLPWLRSVLFHAFGLQIQEAMVFLSVKVYRSTSWWTMTPRKHHSENSLWWEHSIIWGQSLESPSLGWGSGWNMEVIRLVSVDSQLPEFCLGYYLRILGFAVQKHERVHPTNCLWSQYWPI